MQTHQLQEYCSALPMIFCHVRRLLVRNAGLAQNNASCLAQESKTISSVPATTGEGNDISLYLDAIEPCCYGKMETKILDALGWKDLLVVQIFVLS